ncbi:MAG TPA: hypothetical protein VGN24_10250 [Rhodanobacter sp.]|jgi:hypothetical protein|nr:hypothetical protein [Rhodanobacter sp.]
MGNTNLPQFGAAHQDNSLDTRSGAGQLTEAQQREVRVPGPARTVVPNPAVTLEQALAGYTGTGHSPAGAT